MNVGRQLLGFYLLSLLSVSPAFAGWSPIGRDSESEIPILREPPEKKQVEESWEDVMQVVGPASKPKASAETETELPFNPETGLEEKTVDAMDEAVEEKPAAAKLPGKVPDEKTLDPEFFYNESVRYLKEEQLQDALNYVNKALELSPNFWKAWYQKALVFQMSGYEPAAARRYLALMKHRPDMIEPHIAMGSLYRKHNDVKLAEAEYRKVIEINHRFFIGHYNLANLLMDQQRMEDALKEYQICLKLQPSNAHVHNNIGVIYQRRDYIEDAIDEFKKASNLDPANQMFVRNLEQAKTKLSERRAKQPM